MPDNKKRCFYTVCLMERGFPVLYICPDCGRLSVFAPKLFVDPGEASQNFLATAATFGQEEWTHEEEMDFIKSCIRMGNIFGVVIHA